MPTTSKTMTASKTLTKGAWVPKAGDGIWDINSQWCVIKGVNTRGIYAVNDGDPATSTDDIVGFHVQYPNGREVKLFPLAHMRCRESFIDFLTRPTGFGKMHWGIFFILQVFLVVFTVMGGITWDENGWTAIVAVVVIEAALVFGSWMNYSRKWV